MKFRERKVEIFWKTRWFKNILNENHVIMNPCNKAYCSLFWFLEPRTLTLRFNEITCVVTRGWKLYFKLEFEKNGFAIFYTNLIGKIIFSYIENWNFLEKRLFWSQVYLKKKYGCRKKLRQRRKYKTFCFNDKVHSPLTETYTIVTVERFQKTQCG